MSEKMSKREKYLVTLNFPWIFLVMMQFKLADSYRFEPNTLTLTNFSSCPEDEKNIVHANFSIDHIARNKYVINGEVFYSDQVLGRIEAQIVATRCDLNMTHCENFDTFVVHDLCRILNLENQLWSDFMAHADPKIKCPTEKNTRVKITDAPVDMGYVAHLPLDGYMWNFTVKIFKSDVKKRTKKRLVFCMTFKISISKTRLQKKRKNKIEKS